MRIWAALILLSGCVPAEDGRTPTPCDAARLAPLIGTPADGHDFAAGTRIIFPGSAVTMDHNPERLNVDVDDDGVILRFWCG